MKRGQCGVSTGNFSELDCEATPVPQLQLFNTVFVYEQLYAAESNPIILYNANGTNVGI